MAFVREIMNGKGHGLQTGSNFLHKYDKNALAEAQVHELTSYATPYMKNESNDIMSNERTTDNVKMSKRAPKMNHT